MKVTVPKEEIDRIIQEYGTTENEAVKAYLDAQEASQEAFQQILNKQLGTKKNGTGEKRSVPVFTPHKIKEHLDRYVIGQEEYKKRLSIAAAFHFAILRYLDENPQEAMVKRFRKKNTIIAGPSGSGKTYCVEVLGDLLEVPTLIIDATDYTEAGYVGKSADDMIRELVDMAPGASHNEKGEFINKNGGIIFIDEIDKKAKDGQLVGYDISREGFQRAVLKLIERKFVSIDNPMSPASQIQEMINAQRGGGAKKQDNMISTEKILFIIGGSFQRANDSLEEIVKDRIKHQTGRIRDDGSFMVTGFGPEDSEGRAKAIYNLYKEADVDDYIRFGLIPELVGRIPIRSYVNLLSKNDLIRIMRDTEDSIIHQYTAEFKAFGINLQFEDKAIEYVAGLSENKKTGARALVSVWENIFTDFQYELPGSHFKELTVTENLCRAPKDELLKLLELSPFVDFTDRFIKEFSIELDFDKDAQEYIEKYAVQNNIQISDALKQLLKGASSLNYMNITGKYSITVDMLKNPLYFDKLFTEWYQNSKNDEQSREQKIPGDQKSGQIFPEDAG